MSPANEIQIGSAGINTHRHFAVVVCILQECFLQAAFHVNSIGCFYLSLSVLCRLCLLVHFDSIRNKLKGTDKVNAIPQVVEVVALKPIKNKRLQ